MISVDGYEIIKKLGTGAFGTVYKANHLKSNNIVAIKVENKERHSRLIYECEIYKALDNALGFPKLYDFQETSDKNICILDYLGPSLEDLFEFSNGIFSIKTVLMVGIQVLNRIEELHNIGYLHRDIKPDNFLIGLDTNKDIIYLIDLGLSKIFNKKSYKKTCSFKGTLRYSSLRNHKGIEQSYRDDLESLAYMLIYFSKNSLPWQNIKIKDKLKKKEKIYTIKKTNSVQTLCSGLPIEFEYYLKYVQVLMFKEKPDYKYLINLFKNILKKRNLELDNEYDWSIKINSLQHTSKTSDKTVVHDISDDTRNSTRSI